jgi:hypothetical protein
MRRTAAAAVLYALAVCLFAPPVTAGTTSDIRLTIDSRDERVLFGETVSLFGRTRGLPAGATVYVQRRMPDGPWKTIARARVRADRSWARTVDTRRGTQDFRLVAFQGRGTTFSAPETVVAMWRPHVSAQVERRLERNWWNHVVSGRAPHLGGTTAFVELDSGDGWQPAAQEVPLARDGTFSFIPEGARGKRLRVCTPRSVERYRACSGAVFVDVTPFASELELTKVESVIDTVGPDSLGSYTHTQFVVLTLQTNLPAGTTVRIEHRLRSDQEWIDISEEPIPGSGVVDLPLWTFPDDSEVRVSVDPTPDVEPVTTATHPYDLAPIEVELDGRPFTVKHIPTDRGGLLRFFAEAGQVIHPRVLDAMRYYLDYELLDPDGEVVPPSLIDMGNRPEVSFYLARESGWYTLVLSTTSPNGMSDSHYLDLVTPLVHSGAAYGDIDISAPAGQTAEYHFTGSAGQVVTLGPIAGVPDGTCSDVDLIALGQYENPVASVPPPYSWYPAMDIYVLPADGAYLWRVTPCRNDDGWERLWRVVPTLVNAQAGWNPFTADLPAGGWLAVSFEAEAGDHIYVQAADHPAYDFRHDEYFPGSLDGEFVMTPDGSVAPHNFVAEETGTYTYWGHRPWNDGTDGASTLSVLVERLTQ